jgi:23S rRNA pseudouridine955/2504/2580 synthase
MAIVSIEDGGRNAVTHWRVKERFGNYTLIHFQLETGRTHQIRVHLQKLGHAILGDDKYGFEDLDKISKSKRLYLHAHLAGFTHPRTGEKMRIESPLPAEFTAMMKNFEVPVKQS